MAADAGVSADAIINLKGGMIAWDGGVIGDYPRIELLSALTDPQKMLTAAMNLEKGALLFYEDLCRRFPEAPLNDTFAKLAQAEQAHAKSIYPYLRKINPEAGAFETLFDSLSGDILEGGVTMEAAVNKVAAVSDTACLQIIELALQIEYAAFDLYRVLASQVADTQAREAFLALSQAEKKHIHTLAQVIPDCP